MKWYQTSNIKVDNSQDWGTYRNLTYSGNGKYFKYTNSGADASWSEGAFTRTGNSTNPSYPYYYHASGLNTNGIKKNIADLGGNVWEWSAEYYSKGIYSNRGGSSVNNSNEYSSSNRFSNPLSCAEYYLGFRVVLYIQ